MQKSLSKVDQKILGILQKDSTLSLGAISEKVNLSIASCHRRIKALEANGVIKGRRAILDPTKLGFAVTGIFMINLEKDSSEVDSQLLAQLRDRPEVIACYLVTGDSDFIIIAKFRTAEEYTDYIYNFIETFRALPIHSYTSSLVIRTLRETFSLPI